MKVGLLFGGKSFEHDISIITANLCYHALKENHEIYLLYIDKNGEFKIVRKMNIEDFIEGKKYKNFSFIRNGIKHCAKKVKLDVIISAMHGTNGEDGLANVIASIYDIPFVGSNHISSGIIIDKYFTHAVLCLNNIKTLNTNYYYKDDFVILEKYPVLIKPSKLGSSIGISKISNELELENAKDNAFKFDDKIVVQPFIENFKEYNQAIFICGKEIYLSKVEEVFKTDDILTFDDKYIDSKTDKKHIFLTDDKLIEKISYISKKIYKLFQLSGVVRIDYMLINGEIFVNEINSTPGSFAYYLFDFSLSELLQKIIKNALFEYQQKRSYVFESSVLSQKYSYKK